MPARPARRFRSLVLVVSLLAPLAGLVATATPAGADAGELDMTFDNDGIATSPAIDSADDMLIQPDGKIVVAGRVLGNFAVARYTPGGALDSSFGGGDGVVTTSVFSVAGANAVALTPDGKIVAAGSANNAGNSDITLVRYTSAGVLDTTFGGGDGIVTTPIGTGDDTGLAMAITGSGSIVVAGRTFNGVDDDFVVVRYSASGVPDSFFGGGDGIVTTPIGSGGDSANSVAIQSDSKIVAVGQTFVGSSTDMAVVRYTSSGVLDSLFGGGDGIVTTPIGSANDVANAVAIQPDGRAVVGGYTFTTVPANEDFAVVRYTTSGALDSTFGGGDGIVTTPVGSSSDFATDLALQPDGSVVVVGLAEAFPEDIAVVRYSSTGDLDARFGGGDGIVRTSIGPDDDQAQAVALQADGKIVVGGWTRISGSDLDLAVLRYLTDSPAISISDAAVTEGDAGTSTATFNLTRSGSYLGASSAVHYVTRAASATAADYVAASGTFTFSPGQTSKSLNVAVKGDLIDEPTESFNIELSQPTNADIQDGTAEGTITDNDPTPSLTVADNSLTEGNTGTTYAVFTITLSNPSSDAVTVDFETANGTATAPSDYTAKSGTKVFLAGQTSKTVSVAVTGDTTEETTETFSLNLLDPSGATIGDGQGVGTITDDDKPTISIGDVSKVEGQSGTTQVYSFTVTVNHASANTITVAYATADGSAVAPGDYTAKAGSLSFAPGATSKLVKVTVKGDNTAEPNETFFVNLSSSTNATIADGQGLGTIVNND